MPYEMAGILAEARDWGFNRYSDWFDTLDALNLYAGPGRFNLARALWRRKFENYAEAARQGMDLGLMITPNHVFMDQVTPDTAATLDPADHRIFGQLVCPSKPGVQELILEFYRRLFADFAERGLALKQLGFGAYDYGGCACEACRPWIVRFGQLSREIAALARRQFGVIETVISGWYFSAEDYRLFAEWVDRDAPDFCDAMVFQAPLGAVTDAAWIQAAPHCASIRAFVHTPNGERQNHDIYGHFGPNIAPARMEQTVAALRARGGDGVTAYSEGDMDEINRAIVAGLASDRFQTADDVLKAYADRHLGGDVAGWSAWLRAMGDVETADAAAARREFNRLKPGARDTWRLRALEGKVLMLEADRRARAASPGGKAAALARRDFMQAKAVLWREAWKMGLGREIFKFDVPWGLPEWAK